MTYREHERIETQPFDICEYHPQLDTSVANRRFKAMRGCGFFAALLGGGVIALGVADDTVAGFNVGGQVYSFALTTIVLLAVSAITCRLLAEAERLRTQILAGHHETQWVFRHVITAHLEKKDPLSSEDRAYMHSVADAMDRYRPE